MIVGENVRVFAEQADTFDQQIAKVAGVQNFEAVLIGGVKFTTHAVAKCAGFAFGNLLWPKRLVFPAIDQIRQLARWPAFVVDVFRLNDLLEQADRVVGI